MGWFSNFTHSVTHPLDTVSNVASSIASTVSNVATTAVNTVEKGTTVIADVAATVGGVVKTVELLPLHAIETYAPTPIANLATRGEAVIDSVGGMAYTMASHPFTTTGGFIMHPQTSYMELTKNTRHDASLLGTEIQTLPQNTSNYAKQQEDEAKRKLQEAADTAAKLASDAAKAAAQAILDGLKATERALLPSFEEMAPYLIGIAALYMLINKRD